MSSNPAAPTDEPSSHLSTRLSTSPDEDPGTARQAHNGSRELVPTAPRSLSSLPTEIVQNIFTQLYQSLETPHVWTTGGLRGPLRYILLGKRIFNIALPLWTSRFTLLTDPTNPSARRVHDPMLAAFFAHPEYAEGVRHAVIRLQKSTFDLACFALGKLSHLTTLDIGSTSALVPDESAPLVAALKSLTSLRSLRLSALVCVRNAPWDSLRLNRDLPLVRHLAVDDESLIDVLAPGFGRLTRLTVGHFAMGRNHIPWLNLRRLELRPDDEAFEPAQFIESLTAYMCEPANPPLPLEELVLAFPTLRQANEEEFNHFLGFLESFPALQELRLSQFDILQVTATNPTPISFDAKTVACLSWRKLACLGPTLVILLFSLQSTKVTKVAYRESLTDGEEMRWQREPGGAFKGERWTLR